MRRKLLPDTPAPSETERLCRESFGFSQEAEAAALAKAKAIIDSH